MLMKQLMLAMTIFSLVTATLVDERPNMVFFIADDASQEDFDQEKVEQERCQDPCLGN